MEARAVVLVQPRIQMWAHDAMHPSQAIVLSPDADFERFFIAHYDRLVRSLTAMTGDAEAATDSVQEAFIKAYSRWSKVRRYDNPATWVRRVAINKSRDTHRSVLNRRSREDRFDAVPPGQERAFDAIDADLDLAGALHDLTPQQRIVASLFYIEDISVADIAATLDLSEGAIKFHLNKARKSLEAILAPQGRAANG